MLFVANPCPKPELVLTLYPGVEQHVNVRIIEVGDSILENAPAMDTTTSLRVHASSTRGTPTASSAVCQCDGDDLEGSQRLCDCVKMTPHIAIASKRRPTFDKYD